MSYVTFMQYYSQEIILEIIKPNWYTESEMVNSMSVYDNHVVCSIINNIDMSTNKVFFSINYI